MFNMFNMLKSRKINPLMLALVGIFCQTGYAQNTVDELTLSDDKQQLAVAYENEEEEQPTRIKLFSLTDGKERFSFSTQEKNIRDMDFNDDGSRLVVSDWGDTVWVWDTKTGKLLAKKHFSDDVEKAFFDGNHITVIIDDEGLFSYDNQLSKIEKKWTKDDFKRLLKQANGNKMIAYIDTPLMASPNPPWQPITSHLLQGNTLFINNDRSIQVWDRVNKTQKASLEAPYIGHFVLSPVKNEIWIYDNQKVAIWDYDKQKLKKILNFADMAIEEISHVTFSPDSKWVSLTLNIDGNHAKVILLDRETLTVKKTLQPSEQYVYSTLFLDDNRLFFNSQTPEVWDVNSGKRLFNAY